MYSLAANKSDLLRQVLLTYVFDQDYGPLLTAKTSPEWCTRRHPDAFLTRFAGRVTRLHQRTAWPKWFEPPHRRSGRRRNLVLGNSQQGTDCRQLTLLLNDRGWLRWRLVNDQQWNPRRYRAWPARHCAPDMRTPSQESAGLLI